MITLLPYQVSLGNTDPTQLLYFIVSPIHINQIKMMVERDGLDARVPIFEYRDTAWHDDLEGEATIRIVQANPEFLKDDQHCRVFYDVYSMQMYKRNRGTFKVNYIAGIPVHHLIKM